jgi:uncharacterized membrane protein HdeD (DUF308 family)
MATTAPTALALVKQGSKWGIIWGVLLVILGMLAIAEPFLAAIALATFIAWLLVFVGVVHMAVAFHAHSGTSMGWKFLVGLAYIFIGGYLLFRPVVGVATLTLMLAFLFLVEGVLDFMLWWKSRSARGAIWILFDSIVTLVLGGMIYVHWPTSSVWAIGTLVGISMIMSGVTRLMLSMAVRKIATQMA